MADNAAALPAAGARRATPTFLPSIQAGRGIAALLVLLFHASEAAFGADGRYVLNGGAAGVDIFFVVSGFIITYVSRGDTAGRFFLKRAIRIAPLYYFYTTIVVAILLVAPTLYANLRFDWSFVAASYLFILSPSNVGDPGVLVGVGWTLAYEAYFYTLMTIGILLLGARGWLFACAIIIIGAVLSPFVHPPAPLIPLLTALPVEFLGGVLLARLFLADYRLNVAAAVAAIIAGLAVIIIAGAIGAADGIFYEPARILWYGLPAAAIVAGLIALHGRVNVAVPLMWLGDISYSLYLSHPFVIKAITVVTGPLHLPPALLLVVLPCAALLAGTISYRVIERPSTRFLSRRLAVRDPLPAARES